ncbi:MAG: hypothetical protein K5930_12840 [Treponemataceae bacterium]|nr:hypothetical protein [Treponemataceae bacterium]
MKKILILSLILLFALGPCFAEEPELDGKIALGMGFGVGEFSMVGLQYHQWLGSHGIFATVGLSDDHKSALLGYQFCVYETSFTDILNSRLYVWVDGGADYMTYSQFSYDGGDPSPESQFNAVAAGGIGMEFVWWHHLSVPVQFGYVAKFPNNTSMSFYFTSGVRYRI